MMITLPHEAIIEILSWLPDKPLFRFKCVSKTWYELLTNDHHFAKLHLQRANLSKTTIMLLPEQTTCCYRAKIDKQMLPTCYETIPLDLPFPNHPTSVYGPLHGLLCFIHNPSLYHYYNKYRKSYHEIIIWSPLTRDYITIPSHEPSSQQPTGNPAFGFGHDQGNDQFKVVRMDPTRLRSCVSVYAIGTNEWKTLQVGIQYRVSPVLSSSAYVNGAVHWIAGTSDSFCFDVILAFDLREYTFQEIPCPQGVTLHEYWYASLCAYAGMLCLLIEDGQQCIQMWVMKQYANAHSWTKQLHLQLSEKISRSRNLKPLGVANNGHIILKAESPLEFFVCDKTTNKSSTIKKYAKFYNACASAGYFLSPVFIDGVKYIRAWKNTDQYLK